MEGFAGAPECGLGLFVGRLGPFQLCTELLGILLSALDDAALIANSVTSRLDVNLVLADLLEQVSGFAADNLVDVRIDFHHLFVKREQFLVALGDCPADGFDLLVVA